MESFSSFNILRLIEDELEAPQEDQPPLTADFFLASIPFFSSSDTAPDSAPVLSTLKKNSEDWGTLTSELALVDDSLGFRSEDPSDAWSESNWDGQTAPPLDAHWNEPIEFCQDSDAFLTTDVKMPEYEDWHDPPPLIGPIVDITDCWIDDAEVLRILNRLILFPDVCQSFRSQGGLSLLSSRSLAHVLRTASCLTKLDISRNNLDASALVIILRQLKTNTILRKLNLSVNPIGAEIAPHIGEILRVNSTLQYLGIRDIVLEDAAGSVVISSLKHNSTLKMLDLGNNSLGRLSGSALADVLLYNSTLEFLDIKDNQFLSSSHHLFQNLL